ncbi:DNA sulfur modification protein DndE [Kordiimonas sp.]|uniref:DNA sulfur modification protein DndE n=1 Tax=Kordiimonas sp. TaxID=1970157 RepID=UPI003A9187F2
MKISQLEKDQLARLKRHTGIEHWNFLCRWAFNISLREKTRPPRTKISSDSNVEMTWKTFGGEHAGLYYDLLQLRCVEDGLTPDSETLYREFRQHLKRGIGYLSSNKNIRSIRQLLNLAVPR